jgi:galactokinase
MQGFIVKAPGRVNLIGEHTDYNAGKVLPFAIDQHIYFTVKVMSNTLGFFGDTKFEFETTMKGQPRFQWSGQEIKELIDRDHIQEDFTPQLGFKTQTWQAYMIGAIHMHFRRYFEVPISCHIKILVDSSLAPGAGISSSAALCCGMLRALAELQQIDRDPIELSVDAMHVEHRFAKTKCGLMDQIAVTMSKKGHFTEIDFAPFYHGNKPQVNFIEAHPIFSQYQILTINTMVKHKLSDSPYNERRETCARILQVLNKHFNLKKVGLGEYASECLLWDQVGSDGSQEALKKWLIGTIFLLPNDAAKVSHAICENIRVDKSIAALKKGDLQAITQAINESHESLSKDFEVSCKELDLLRRTVAIEAGSMAKRMNLTVPGMLGARMTGGGFGGSTVQFVHESLIPSLVAALSSPSNPYTAQTKKFPNILVTPSSVGIEVEKLK